MRFLRFRAPKPPAPPTLLRRLTGWLAPVVGIGAIAWIVYIEHIGTWPLGADPEDATQVALGERVYAKQCAACHGADLEGSAGAAPPLDGASASARRSDAAFLDVTKAGAGRVTADGSLAMPAFNRQLTDAQMLNALAYIKSRWPAEVRAAQPAAR